MNLDIEGTKHEKVVIIILAYVIGFTAGFISFGMTQGVRHDRMEHMNPPAEKDEVSMVAPIPSDGDGETADDEAVVPSTEPTAVSEAIAPGDVVPPGDTSAALAITYTNGKLVASVAGNTYLLSMKSSGMDSAAQSAFKNQGLHTDIPKYSTSPDNLFVYFCEQQSSDDACNSFVFDVAKNVIEYVTVDGKKLVTTSAVAKTATWSQSGLTIDNHTSADATAPAALIN